MAGDLQERAPQESYHHPWVRAFHFILMTSVLTQSAVFMNKCDILKKKLEAGLQVNKHMTSYGTRENDANVFAKCTSMTPFQ